jgi:glycosyltransferase involved in cell wall biosynthesis
LGEKRKLKIFVIGTRGIPHIPGGVERHCEELYPRIVARGHQVYLCTRSPYVTHPGGEWHGVKLINCYAPRKKNLEAIVHTFYSLVKARAYCSDVVHVHGIGPSLLVPFARLMGLKVVVTNHGPDYDRAKWGKTAKAMLRLGEKLGGVYANEVIAISSMIANIIHERCHRESNLIYNGVTLPQKSKKKDCLEQFGIRPGKYVLAVARFVPEKGLHDLIEAFKMLDSKNKLVIAGDADYETAYSKNLRKNAAQDKRIVLTGYLTGEPLNQVYTHAVLFVLPSNHEGLPIALLEAMSYGIPVLVSDILANREVGLPADRYFQCGDVYDLKKNMELFLERGVAEEEQKILMSMLEERYNWNKIAEQTIKVYRKIIANTT